MGRYNKTVHNKRQTNLGWAICTMFLCFPVGLFALFIALKSKTAWREGHPESGGDMAEMAKTISLFGILFSIIIIIVFLALLASGKLFELMFKLGILSWGDVKKLNKSFGNPEPIEPTKESEYEYYYVYADDHNGNGGGDGGGGGGGGGDGDGVDEYYYYSTSTEGTPGK